ncbi:PREDICTED: ral guanine nucleotide dissociation stimulator-like 3 isoform X1 [Cyprinodon variegatus]|uniref:Ral guanine nucleotide dissociation stimulator-like 3a n=2 Tax=Cyprinodon variegatus TaxID=28743 RepID=A0A3Q2GHD7_CYPVA|nr:PREDICTED: ral guanine nucleotide dissociation stimulator-like 3 isoform X1 [Cyprinodon variegatus]XP_015248867.1 PREDICTED: ral guanine nucleotide dissociation stimulator-like 3 isoform X1 [Cyprinodon variegatus]
MRTTLPLCRGDDEAGGHQRSFSRVGWMKRLLWLRSSQCGGVHMDTEPGVWLRSFQLLDTDGQHEEPVQEWGEEEEDGAIFGITLRREPALSGSGSPDFSPAFGGVQYHTVKVRRLKAATLERLVSHLLDPERREPDFIHVFLSTYRAFTSASSFIELLFQRDESLSNLDNAVSLHSPALPVVRLWLEEYSSDFQEPPQYPALRLLCSHLRRRLCFRRLFQTAEALLKRLQAQDSSRSVSENQMESQQCSPQSDEELTSKQDKPNFMDFPAVDVAEQLTRLDAELFVKVEPFHCLGCIWSQRDKKQNRNLAPTVRATICQFNAVTNCVITSLLCPSSPSPSLSSPFSSPSSTSTFLYPSSTPGSPHCSRFGPVHRAHIIEWWITVAQECRRLKNFSSLKAILSALQSNAVYRLKKTWAAVSRESMTVFDHLCETFPDENCVLTNREVLVESLSCGIVPYLGTYLTVLTMLDTALTDTVEGCLINFEKRRREYEILSQIKQLQGFCSHYRLSVNSCITAWLQAQTLLTDQESYELSRELEPPVDPCPNSPNSRSGRLLATKLASLRTSHSDQISVSSSGSSGSDLEDLSIPQPSPFRLKLKSLPGSLHNVAEDFSMSSSSSPSLSGSSCSSSHPDLSSPSLTLSPDSSQSTCSPQGTLPLYNKQIADSCIIRVTVECVSNGNIYKSILLTSQDHTPQVIQRALEKHNMEDFRSSDFGLYQLLNHGRELHIPDNANVFYAMCTSANYDFVLRQRWRSHGRQFGSFSSPGARPRGRHIK